MTNTTKTTTRAIKKGYATGKHLMIAFAASHMTIYNWTNGTANKEPIPSEKDGAYRLYKIADVKKWAKVHGIPFAKPLEDVVTENPAANEKRGPKPGNPTPAAKKSQAAASKAKQKGVKPAAKTAKVVSAKKAPTKPARKADKGAKASAPVVKATSADLMLSYAA